MPLDVPGRPTDAPPRPPRPATPRRRSTRRAAGPSTSCRATWRSSWTATGAGPGAAACPSCEGHAAGVEAIRPIVEHAVRRGVEVLSLYAFSRENWARSDEEVAGAVRAAGARPSATRRAELRAPGRPGPRSSAASTSCPADTRSSIARGRSTPRPAAPACTSTSPSTTRAAPSSWMPSGAAWRTACGPTQIDEAAIAGAPLHRRPARSGPRDPHRRRPAPHQLPDLAVGLRRVLLLRQSLARLRPGRLRRGARRVREPRSRRFGR